MAREVESAASPEVLGKEMEALVKRCPPPPTSAGRGALLSLLSLLPRAGSVQRWMHVEKLEEHDGSLAYTRAQGED